MLSFCRSNPVHGCVDACEVWWHVIVAFTPWQRLPLPRHFQLEIFWNSEKELTCTFMNCSKLPLTCPAIYSVQSSYFLKSVLLSVGFIASSRHDATQSRSITIYKSFKACIVHYSIGRTYVGFLSFTCSLSQILRRKRDTFSFSHRLPS